MKVSDYIVEFLIKKNIKHVFGYPGGMVIHLIDSLMKYEEQITAHVSYHEQAASFEACAYAQVSNSMCAAYATSGPGATNMITGICNAYFDSIPVLFITGQVNTSESRGSYAIRQRGFQETGIVDIVKSITKYSSYVEDANKIGFYLEKAYQAAMTGRKGPVLLDLPMDIQRTDIDPDKLEKYCCKIASTFKHANYYPEITQALQKAKRPCMVLGSALKEIPKDVVLNFVDFMDIPVVTSMLAVDLFPHGHTLYHGFIGAYGTRTANFVVAKSDLLLILGSRMDVRQVGGNRADFASKAKLIRVDIDQNELDYQIRKDEIDINTDLLDVIQFLKNNYKRTSGKYTDWINICNEISLKLNGFDNTIYNMFVENISQHVPDNTVITTDVGQNQVWIAQSFQVKKEQRILFSGGHGAMGYSLPAAIGAFYAADTSVISFHGDGGIQMNMQELQFIYREQLPIKIFVFNNYALGMIRHFQEMYFEQNYTQTVEGSGYLAPNFEAIAKAYNIKYICYEKLSDVSEEFMLLEGPVLIEIKLKEDTYVYPKIEFGKVNQDQQPLLERDLYQELMEM